MNTSENNSLVPVSGASLIYAKAPTVSVVRIFNPFDVRQRAHLEVDWEPTRTVREYVEAVRLKSLDGLSAEFVVSINGMLIKREDWERHYLSPGDCMVICPVPQGGGESKGIFRMVAMLTMAIATPWLASTMLPIFSPAVGQAMVMVGGALLINALMPITTPKPSTPQSESPSYGVDGPKNVSTEGIPVPVVYGEFRVGGNLINTFVTNEDDNERAQFLHLLYVASEGPIDGIDLNSVLINDQPIANFSDKEVDQRVGLPDQSMIKWFDDTITPHQVGQTLGNDYIVYQTIAPIDKFRVDVLFPFGLAYTDSKGRLCQVQVKLYIEYRLLGELTWTSFTNGRKIEAEGWAVRYKQGKVAQPGDTAGYVLNGLSSPSDPQPRTQFNNYKIYRQHTQTYYDEGGSYEATWYEEVGYLEWSPIWSTEAEIIIKGETRTALRRSFESPTLTQGVYEIRVRRDPQPIVRNRDIRDSWTWHPNYYIIPDPNDPLCQHQMQWTDLNEIAIEDVRYKNTALLGLRIRLSDQLNSIPRVTYVVRGRLVRVWVGDLTGQFVEQWSSNPAWIALDMMTNTRYGGALSDDRIDMAAWKEWAAYCDEKGLTFNGVFDAESNLWDALQYVFRCGHAQIVPVGTRYSVAIERAGSPTMMFGVGNIVKNSFKINWLPLQDRANEIEVTYYDREDNFKAHTMKVYDSTALALGAQARQASINLIGVTDAERAHREGVFLLNINRYIQQTVEFDAPLEAIACAVGDLVYIQHDMPQWGYAGRLEAPDAIRNQLTWSEDFTQSVWDKHYSTITPDVQSVPGGLVVGDRLQHVAMHSGTAREITYALKFDGSDDLVTVPDTAALRLVATDFTIEAWVYVDPDPTTQFPRLVTKWNGMAGWHLGLNNGNPLGSKFDFDFQTRSSGFQTAVAATAPTGEWVHVAATFEDATNTGRLYVNGVLAKSGWLPKCGSDTSDLLICQFHKGRIRDVRIWDVARSEAEIAADMNSRLTGGESGLIAYWPFDEGTGSGIQDATGNGNDGAITDAIWVEHESGVPAAGPDVAIRLAATAPAANDALNGMTVRLSDGREGRISDYDGTSKIATLEANWHAAYLSLPGISGNYASTPDSAALAIAGDLDIRAKVALDDWTPADYSTVIGQRDTASVNNSGVTLRVQGTSGKLELYWGSGAAFAVRTSTVAVGAADGDVKWIRATLDADNGAGGHDVKFYTSADGVTWTQLGGTVRTAGVAAINDSTAPLRIGAIGNGESQLLAGKVYYAEVRNGIDGEVVAKFDPTQARIGDTSVPSETGETWTIHQSGDPVAELAGVPDATTGYEVYGQGALQRVNIAYTPGTVITLSFYRHVGTGRWVVCRARNSANNGGIEAWYDLQNGVVGVSRAVGSGNPVLHGANIEDLGDGWYRCSIKGVVSDTDSLIRIETKNSIANDSFTADIDNYTYVHAAQLENGDLTEYQRVDTVAIEPYSTLNLDREVTLSPGVNYKALVLQDYVVRYTGTISAIDGNIVTLSNYAGQDDVKRLRANGLDLAIEGFFATGVMVESAAGLSVGATYELVDTDVIEERDVVGVEEATTTRRITVTTPFPVLPARFSNFMFGETTKVKKPFRIRSISGSSEHTRRINAIEYNESVYDWGSDVVPTPNYSALSLRVDHVTIEGTYERLVRIGNVIQSQVTVSWTPANAGLYQAADIYVRRRESGFSHKARVYGGHSYTLDGLEDGELVTFKIVAVDVTGLSAPYETAPTIDHEVVGKTLPPSDVTGLAFDGLFLTWSEVADVDRQGYVVRVHQGSNTDWDTAQLAHEAGHITNTRFDVSNIAQVGASVTFLVKAIDTLGKLSSVAATIEVDLRPADVMNFTATAQDSGVVLSWSAVSNPRLKGYEIRKGVSWDTAEFVALVDGTSHRLDVLSAGSHEYLIKAIDRADNESINAASAQISIVAAPAPTVSAVFDNADVILSWTAQKGTFAITEFEVRYGSEFASATVVGRVKATTMRLRANWLGSRDFWVAAIDPAGNVGAAGQTTVTVSAASITRVLSQVIDNTVLLRWEAVAGSLPIHQYEIRRGGDSFETAEHIGVTDSTFHVILETLKGEKTYRVAPVDTAGNRGTSRALTITVDSPPDFILRNQFLTDWLSEEGTNLLRVDHLGQATEDRVALEFDGVDDYIIINPFNNMPATEITIEFRVQTTGNGDGLVSYAVPGSDNEILIGNQESISLYIKGSSVVTGVNIADGLPHDVAMTWRGSDGQIKLFVDGVERYSGTLQQGASITNGGSLVFAVEQDAVGGGFQSHQFMPGKMAEVRIWDHVRTPAQIEDYRHRRLVGDETGLVGYWPLNDREGEVANDRSVNDNDGDIIGALWYVPEISALLPFPVNETVADRETVHGFTSPQAQIDAGYSYVAQPVPTQAVYEMVYDAGVVIPATRIIVTLSDAIVAAGSSYTVQISTRESMADPWFDHSLGSEVLANAFRYVKVRLVFTSDGVGWRQGDQLETILRTKVKNDMGVVDVQANPTTVNFTVEFLDVTSIVLTPESTTPRVAVLNFNDVPNPTTFEVSLFDTNGNPVTGRVHWTARGH